MGKHLFLQVCTLSVVVVCCVALTPSAIKKLLDSDPRMARVLNKVDKRIEAVSRTNISEECTTALVQLVNSSNAQLKLAYADASGKIPSGILEGDFLWIGSYSECKLIPSSHYCMTNVLLNKWKVLQNRPIILRWGVCVPDACSELDVAVAIEDIIEIFGLQTKILISTKPDPRSIYCAKPSEYSAGAIVCLVICGILCLLCLGGTIIELIEDPPVILKLKEDSVHVQNGSALREEAPSQNDSTFHNDQETLLNAGNLQPSMEYLPRKTNVIVKIIKCFSIITNTKKIMDTKTAPGAINSINGMRVLSISWVILGHTYFFFLTNNAGNNLVSGIKITQRFSFQAIDNAFVSVDSFFFLSGLLVGYIGLKRMAKNDGRLPWFQFYFHRYWRLTPSLMFCIFFYATLNGHLNEGPLWYTNQQPTACDSKWWTNLLYINNFYPNELGKECLGWSWYLANDMQFYIVSPIILYAMYKCKLLGTLISVGSFLVASFIATGAIIGYYDLSGNMGTFFQTQQGNKANDYSNMVYIKPYCRISPYLVGMALGYILFSDKTHSFVRKLQPISRLIFSVVGWSVAFICSFASLYGGYRTMKENPVPFTQTENVIYGTFFRFSWALGLAWVIYACQTGIGGVVDTILSAKFWIPLSRLTYGTYLVHPIVLTAFYSGLQHTVAYTDYLMVMYFLGFLVISHGIAFILAIALEFPAMQLEKLF